MSDSAQDVGVESSGDARCPGLKMLLDVKMDMNTYFGGKGYPEGFVDMHGHYRLPTPQVLTPMHARGVRT